MILVRKQFEFSNLLRRLLGNVKTEHRVQLRELWRSKETCELYAKEGKGVRNSCHEIGLAVDLNIWVFNNSKNPADSIWILSQDKADYQYLGDTWKRMSTADVVCCWGGDFHSLCDFFHFSIEHQGVR